MSGEFFAGPPAGEESGDGFTESERLSEVYRVEPGTRVEISGVRGPVVVECFDAEGAGDAEVRVVCRARARADFAHHRIAVGQTPEALFVRGERAEGAPSAPAQVLQHVLLRLPARVALSAAKIDGPLRIGEVDGPVRVESVNGPLELGGAVGESFVGGVCGPCRIGRASGRLRVESVSGPLEVGWLAGSLYVERVSGGVSAVVASLGEDGLHLSGVSGPVELLFEGELHADLDVRDVQGPIICDLPGAGGPPRSTLRARVGEGTAPVSVSAVSGPVRVARKG